LWQVHEFQRPVLIAARRRRNNDISSIVLPYFDAKKERTDRMLAGGM
jgi:hypothetical protein